MLDDLPFDIPSDNLFAPLVRAWTNKIEAGVNVRKKWQNLVDEIMLFYSKSAAALFDPAYARKFWPGNVKPRFRVNINLAYEYVAIRLPELLWENPHRQVEPKKMIELPKTCSHRRAGPAESDVHGRDARAAADVRHGEDVG